jgi:hypothetical protein
MRPAGEDRRGGTVGCVDAVTLILAALALLIIPMLLVVLLMRQREASARAAGAPAPSGYDADARLATLERRVETLERHLGRLAADLGTELSADGADSPLPDRFETVRARLAAGRKIDAIKEYRRLTGVGLKEAKDAVEQMV